MIPLAKPVRFLGSSRDDLRAFPEDVRRAIGVELMRVQSGLAPVDFKAMPGVGAGTYEIRVRLGGAWRMLYVAKFEDAIYVLHAFEKKTQKTSKGDLDLAMKRYQLIGVRR
jgi:phage-related protein